MLLNLHVKNLALIEEVDIDFSNGLVVLTGETGAGKSLILGSLNIALGNKVSRDIIRNGCEFCLVELTFSVDDRIVEKLKEFEIDFNNDTLTVSRKIYETRSVSKINGETVNLSILKQVMSLLVDIHGQHDHQSLLYNDNHRDILDKFAGEQMDVLKKELKDKFTIYTDEKKKLDKFDLDEASRIRELEFSKFEVNEIDEAELREGEDVEVEAQYKKMSGGQDVITNLSGVYDILSSDNGISINQMTAQAISMVNSIKTEDDQVEQFKSSIYDLEALASELSKDLYSYISNYEYDPVKLNELEKRLNQINNLKHKYGNTIEEILDYRDSKQEYVETLENYELERDTQIKLVNESFENVKTICTQISELRKQCVKRLEDLVINALNDLNFLTVQFEIQITGTDTYTTNGCDKVEFMITTNPGEPLRPLAKVASGGELSRIMLALKSILAKEDEVDTLIFDEIDTGISGVTAAKVAEKLAKISRSHQVLCISHLAQIAAMADYHFLIEKEVKDNSTFTSITELDSAKSINELVRMSGTSQATQAAIAHAIELKDMAEKTKNTMI